MTVEAWLLLATTAIAGVAVVVAAMAIRAVRRLERQSHAVVEVATESPSKPRAEVVSRVADPAPSSTIETRPAELAPRIVSGRVIVPPTQSQVVRTALGRPGVRLSVLMHGLAHALRAENRDRIVALMRREYRHRRRERLRAGRAAVRQVKPSHAPTTDRLHADLLEPRPLGVAERMINP